MSKKQNKVEKLNASVEYLGEGELMSDISSSEPLIFSCKKCGKEYKTKSGYTKHVEKCDIDDVVDVEKIIESVEKNNITISVVETIITKKEKYLSMMNDGAFILKVNGVLVFDSDVDELVTLGFSDHGFSIGAKNFPYDFVN